MTPKSALITGITGQDGSYLAELLCSQGVQVHGLVVAGDPNVDWLRRLVPTVTLTTGSLTDQTSIDQAIHEADPDEIYHLAAASSVAASWQDPVAASEINGTGAIRVMDAVRRFEEASGRSRRLLVCSTAEMFGQPQVSPQDEETPIDPVSPYGAVKAFVHAMARISRDRGQFVSSLILYNHESPRRPEAFVTRKITKAVANIALGSTEPLQLGNIGAKRDWGFAGDYVEAMVAALRTDRSDEFVIATGESHSIEQFVVAAFAAAGIDDWTRHVAINDSLLRPNDPAAFVGDASKARDVLGWRPKVDFAGLVEMMVQHDLAAGTAGSQ